MKYLIAFFTGLMLLLSPLVQAAPVGNHPAQIQFKKNMDVVLGVARNKQLSEAQKVQKIEAYASNYLDYQRLSALAVGLPWKQFTPKQKADFISAFKSMLVSMYAHSALMGAADAKVELLPKVLEPRPNRVDVFTQITSAKGKTYEVGYQLYKVGPLYKIYNINVEGASLVTIYRNQFGELIQKKGIDGTIETLRQKGLKKK